MTLSHKKKVLFLLAHPRIDSFSHSFSFFLIQHLFQSWKVVQRDLYRPPFDPLLREEEIQSSVLSDDVKKEAQLLLSSDILCVLHPVWWYSMPAVLKGWIDRVLRQGVAYEHDLQTGKSIGLLQRKGVVLIRSAGSSMTEDCPDWEKTWKYCGLDVLFSETILNMTRSVSQETVSEKMHEIKNKISERLDVFIAFSNKND